jgi:DNA-binding transcriptional MerR regulator
MAMDTFTLDALVSAANATGLPTAADGRVAARVDERLVRYYQSLGLIERPLRYDGRQAVYGQRHLDQVLAVRRLQAEGLTLAQVQARMPAAGAALEVRQPSPRASALVASRVAPGVTVLIDPAEVADPAGLLSRIQQFLQGEPA